MLAIGVPIPCPQWSSAQQPTPAEALSVCDLAGVQKLTLLLRGCTNDALSCCCQLTKSASPKFREMMMPAANTIKARTTASGGWGPTGSMTAQYAKSVNWSKT